MVTSKTGLQASPKKKTIRYRQRSPVHLHVIAKPAPYILKPFAGLYNPFPYGCSFLCNHPTDNEAKELLKRAKDTWANEGKNLLLAEEIEAIRATLDQLHVNITDYGGSHEERVPIESVPEELFRRYTETDSRPLTPVPTLVSALTKASGTRRCVTPDPKSAVEVREKTMLILDLRRSHSQETLLWHGAVQHQQEVPSIKINKAPTDSKRGPCTGYTPSVTPENPRRRADRSSKTPSPVKSAKSDYEKSDKTYLAVTPVEDEASESEAEGEEEAVKRRGKKKRKRRDSSREAPVFQSIDPETQIATIGPDSHNPSARPSLVPTEVLSTVVVVEHPDSAGPPPKSPMVKRQSSLDIDTFLDVDALKLLRRELTEEIVDNEFDLKRRKALEEALRTVRPDKTPCEELKQVQKEVKVPPTNEDMWLKIPRMFTRSSARFELPMDSRVLSTMTPLEYVREHVSVSTGRKQLYNCIFNRHKYEPDLENETEIIVESQPRRLFGTNLQRALDEMMGKNMTEEQTDRMKRLVGWQEEDVLDFKTFCGLCALHERLLAPEFCYNMPTRKADPCQEIELVDFKSLERRLKGQVVNERLVEILHKINEL